MCFEALSAHPDRRVARRGNTADKYAEGSRAGRSCYFQYGDEPLVEVRTVPLRLTQLSVCSTSAFHSGACQTCASGQTASTNSPASQRVSHSDDTLNTGHRDPRYVMPAGTACVCQYRHAGSGSMANSSCVSISGKKRHQLPAHALFVKRALLRDVRQHADKHLPDKSSRGSGKSIFAAMPNLRESDICSHCAIPVLCTSTIQAQTDRRAARSTINSISASSTSRRFEW